jgi:hypothetical protein
MNVVKIVSRLFENAGKTFSVSRIHPARYGISLCMGLYIHLSLLGLNDYIADGSRCLYMYIMHLRTYNNIYASRSGLIRDRKSLIIFFTIFNQQPQLSNQHDDEPTPARRTSVLSSTKIFLWMCLHGSPCTIDPVGWPE